MKKLLFLSFILFVGGVNLSASKSDKLLGKWQAYKMTRNGETRDVSKDKKVPWIEFEDDNVLWVGEGKKEKERGEWWLDDDNKTLHLVIKSRDREMTITRLSKNKLVTTFGRGRKANKAIWQRVS